MQRLLAVIGALCTSASLHANTGACTVPWQEVKDFAESHGYTFTSVRTAGEGECIVHKLAFLASASNNGPGVTCDLLLFGGKPVAKNWKLKPVAAQGMPFQFVEAAHPPAAVRIRISAPPRKTIPFLVDKVEFVASGGCTDWKAALAE